MKYRILFLLFSAFSLSSCIKDEAPNMEADIVDVMIADSILNVSPIINNASVVVYIKPDKIKVSKFALNLKLTSGATVTPASGSEQDFTYPVVYTVTSEDGNYSKKYTVTLLEASVPQQSSFDTYEFDKVKNYVVFYENFEGMKQPLWGSGNAAYSLLAGSNPKPESYPTQVTNDPQWVKPGQSALYLKTISTGFLGGLVGMPIAAGNLFIGSIDASSLVNPITKFGLPFNKMPQSFEGHYYYRPGSVVKDKSNKVVPNTVDECDIYAVLYNRVALQKRTGLTYLSNDNSLTDESIVAIARIPNGKATAGNGLVKFNTPFEFKGNIVKEELDGYHYNLAVVFSSSINGAAFQGAVGSTLVVDNFKVVTKD
ncbi:MAG: PCMD domain-containing protein [Sphingobacterium sp.]|jgi:hypothetical protein|nr:PCMD domain-containing protein [Sphingobacterium sp.]